MQCYREEERTKSMTADLKAHNLKVVLTLKWLQGNNHEANVAVTITDTCYHDGALRMGLPPGTVGLPEIEYITFFFTHDDGKACGDIVRTVEKTIKIPFSNAKPKVTAFAAVNDKAAGSDTKPFPRQK
jgi:hypothetical protein